VSRVAAAMALTCTAAFGGAFLVTHQLTAARPAPSTASRPTAPAGRVTMPALTGGIAPLREPRPKRPAPHPTTSASTSVAAAPAATAAPAVIAAPHVATSARPVHVSVTPAPKPTAQHSAGYGSGGTTAGGGGSSAGG